MGDFTQVVQVIAIAILPIIFAITLHEAAHGYVARYFGDNTAYLAGRVSLNPMRHIDPIGTVLLPVVILTISILSGAGVMLFGYAKPVPVNFNNLRSPKRDMRWVALAGPAMNLLMAIAWMVFLRVQETAGLHEEFFLDMAGAGVRLNLLFVVLNLLPILPLDGGRVAFSLLPTRTAWQYSRMEPYGLPLVFLLVYLLPGVILLPAQILQTLLNQVI